ncbi:MAG: stalk domain-containing protein [Candidatus Cryosericum sp.]
MKQSRAILALLLVFAMCLSWAAPVGHAEAAVVKTIVLRVGDPVMQVDGVRTYIDATGAVPVIVRGRTMLPVRAIVEALGGKVSWDAVRRAVGIVLGTKTLELVIAKSLATVNGTSVAIDSANPLVVPLIVKGRTMLPVRFVGEQLGAAVDWAPATQAVTLGFGGPPVLLPVTPALMLPDDGSSSTDETPSLSWNAVNGATTYQIVIRKGVEIVLDRSGLTALSFTVPAGLLTAGTYSWTVTATGPGGTSAPQTRPFVFTVKNLVLPPAAPALTTPSDGSSSTDRTPSLGWNAVNGAVTYRVVICRGSDIILDKSGLTALSFTVPTGLLTAVTYSWTVTATGFGGTSAPQTHPFVFTVKDPVIQPLAQTVEMHVKYSGWDPATIHIKAGARVTWIIWGDEVSSCTSRIVVPSLNISQSLTAGKNVITFTAPASTGAVPFACWMNMVRGQFIVDP